MICHKSPDRYHDMFELANTSKEIVERCKYCGYQVVQKKANPNQRAYNEAHLKDMLQPGSRDFSRVYGDKQEKYVTQKFEDTRKANKEMANWKEENQAYKEWVKKKKGEVSHSSSVAYN